MLSRIDRAPGSETAPAAPHWRERAALLGAIAVTAMAGASCVLGFSWLAVIFASPDGQARGALMPWAIACGVLAVAAFVVGLAALLRRRVRVTLVAVASFLMVVLVTTVIGLTMSAPPNLDARAAEPETLLGHGK